MKIREESKAQNKQENSFVSSCCTTHGRVTFSALMDRADCNEVVKGGIAASKRSWDACSPRRRHLCTGTDNSSGPVPLVRAITVRGPE